MPYSTKVNKRGVTKRVPINARQKTARYRDLERGVLDSVRTYLTETNNKHLAEHDGWTCQNEIDETELIDYVRTHTGYEIEIEKEIIELNPVQ